MENSQDHTGNQGSADEALPVPPPVPPPVLAAEYDDDDVALSTLVSLVDLANVWICVLAFSLHTVRYTYFFY